jgi:outer membrane protein assembly factor BamB
VDTLANSTQPPEGGWYLRGMMRWTLVLGTMVAGCNATNPLVVGSGRDLGGARSDHPPHDLGPADLAPVDLAAADHAQADLAAVDLAQADLAQPADLSPTPDAGDTTWTGAAVAYQIDPQHRGAQHAGLTPPLTQKWSVDLSTEISYPLIADGRVFVTLRKPGTGYGVQLMALDAATGTTDWGPTDLGGTYWWGNAAYEAGVVFAVNYDGTLYAFDGATGTQKWSTSLKSQYSFSSPPTALGGTVYAVDEASGNVLWTASVENGDDSSPAVTSSGVFVSYACLQAYAFAPSTGTQLWHHSTGCEGGGGKTTALYGDRLYARDFSGNAILDANSGSSLGTFSAGPIPAFDQGSGFYLSGSTLTAQSVPGGTALWTFTGDGTLDTAPIVVDGYVYVASFMGHLYAVDASTGMQAWSDTVGSVSGPDEQNVSQPLTGLAAANGLLVIPAGTKLIAYSN